MSRGITDELPDGRLAEILKELRRVNERLGAVEEKVDQRQFETKLIWEKAPAEIAELRIEMREEFSAVKNRVDRLEAEFRQLNRRVRVLSEDIVGIRGELVQLDGRLARLEDRAGS